MTLEMEHLHIMAAYDSLSFRSLAKILNPHIMIPTTSSLGNWSLHLETHFR